MKYDFIVLYPLNPNSFAKFREVWSLETAKNASDLELNSFFRSHSSGVAKLIAKRIAVIRDAIPLTTDRAVITSNALLVKGLARELKVLNQTIADYESEIEKIYSSLPDSKIFDSLPSAGEVSAPRLLAAMGTDLSKFSSAEELACFLGIAPVIERSGNQCWIHTRYKCSKPLKQAFVDWTFLSLNTYS